MSHDAPSLRPRCAAAIVFAVPLEADAFEAQATDSTSFESDGFVFREATVHGRRVAWCVAGVGGERAARAVQLLSIGHHPRLIVTAGFAGGLDPAVPRGSVVRPTEARDERRREPIPLLTDAGGPTLPILTVGRIIATAREKQALFNSSGARVVDMETYSVAVAAREAGLRCACIRVVSDDAGHDLPREVASLAGPQSGLRRLGAVVGAIGRRPSAVVDFWRLYEHAVVDGKTLATALLEFLGTLPVTDEPAP